MILINRRDNIDDEKKRTIFTFKRIKIKHQIRKLQQCKEENQYMGEEQISQINDLQIPFPESTRYKYKIETNKQNKKKIDLKNRPRR